MENEQTQPTQPVTTTPVAPVDPSPISPKTSNLPVIILSLLSLLFLSGTVYFYLQVKTMKEKELVSIPSPAPQTMTANPTPMLEPTVSPISNEMSNWQTYTNQKYGFTFKYPLDWKVTVSPTSGDQFNIIVGKKSNTSEAGFVPFQISVNMTQNQDGNNFTTLNETKSHFIKSFESSSVITNNITFDDKQGIILTGVMAGPGPGEGQFISYTLVQLDKKVLVMQLGNKSYQGLFDQITSTLKFTN